MSFLLPAVPALAPAGGLLPAGPAGTVPAALVAAGTGVPAHPIVLAAQAGAAPFDGAPLSVTLLRLVLLTGLAVVAGIGLVRPFAGAPTRTEQAVAGVAALAASGAAVAATTWSGSGTPLWTLGLVLVALAVPALLLTRRSWTAVLPGLAGTVLLATVLSSGRPTTTSSALDAGYGVAAVVLIGAALALFARRADTRRPPIPAPAGVLRLLAIVAGIVATVAALAQSWLSGPFSLVDLAGTGYGRAALVAVAAPAVAVVAVVWERGSGDTATGRARARATAVRTRTRTAAAVLAAAGVAAASVLAALPPAPADAQPGRLLARAVDLGAGPITLVVTPMRPGPNLVQLTGPGFVVPEAANPSPTVHGHVAPGAESGYTVRAGDREVPVTGRAGAPGGWALVDLPAGTSSIAVQSGGVARTVPVDVGTDPVSPPGAAGVDGPECASAVLGAVVAAGPAAGTVTGCPSESLRPDDEQALRETVRALTGNGVPGVAIAADASPRSRAAAEAVRQEVTAAGVPLRPRVGAEDALVVVSGWQDAARVARETSYAANTTPTALGGVYLAPWLLTGGVLGASQSAVLPLPFGPQEPLPQRYVRALAAAVPGSAPSTSGLLAWADRSGEQVREPYGWYGAAPVSVPMSADDDGSGGHHGGPNTAAWFPGGAVAGIGPIGGRAAAPTP